MVLECAVVPWPGGRMPGREMIGGEAFGEGSVFAGGWRGAVRGVLEECVVGGVGLGMDGGFGGVLDAMLRVDVRERVGAAEAMGWVGGEVGGRVMV